MNLSLIAEWAGVYGDLWRQIGLITVGFTDENMHNRNYLYIDYSRFTVQTKHMSTIEGFTQKHPQCWHRSSSLSDSLFMLAEKTFRQLSNRVTEICTYCTQTSIFSRKRLQKKHTAQLCPIYFWSAQQHFLLLSFSTPWVHLLLQEGTESFVGHRCSETWAKKSSDLKAGSVIETKFKHTKT